MKSKNIKDIIDICYGCDEEKVIAKYYDGKPVCNDCKNIPYKRGHSKSGRNDLCPCGSGLKYKNCCFKNR
jgi:preprotein translocase subunit SecA